MCMDIVHNFHLLWIWWLLPSLCVSPPFAIVFAHFAASMRIEIKTKSCTHNWSAGWRRRRILMVGDAKAMATRTHTGHRLKSNRSLSQFCLFAIYHLAHSIFAIAAYSLSIFVVSTFIGSHRAYAATAIVTERTWKPQSLPWYSKFILFFSSLRSHK